MVWKNGSALCLQEALALAQYPSEVPSNRFNFFFVFCLFRVASVAYGCSQARGPIGTAAAGLHHSHGNAISEPRLCPMYSLRQHWILNPLSEARDRNCVIMDTSRVC